MVNKRKQARRVTMELVGIESAIVRHTDSEAPPADVLAAWIEHDALPDEEIYLEPNPDGVDTYYQRVNGGAWVRVR